jgi:3-phosphoshikimate 1-carboxyvinyltransferase
MAPGPGGLAGGTVAVAADESSQFLSGLLLAAPYLAGGLRIEVTTRLVSRPYVELTRAVMAAFGVDVAEAPGPAFVVPAGAYRATDYAVEPDASAAAYLLAAAALVGGRVTVEGLGAGSRQGDARFADLLARMGARVERTATATSVVGTGGRLAGLGGVDLADMPDMAPTVAVLAAFADGPTRVTGVGFIRGHETDRIAAVVTELGRLGVEAAAEPDGFVVRPGAVHGGEVATYDDHRMAMSFALAGLRVPGVTIAGPGCVAKTFPGFWSALESLGGQRARRQA